MIVTKISLGLFMEPLYVVGLDVTLTPGERNMLDKIRQLGNDEYGGHHPDMAKLLDNFRHSVLLRYDQVNVKTI